MYLAFDSGQQAEILSDILQYKPCHSTSLKLFFWHGKNFRFYFNLKKKSVIFKEEWNKIL